MSKLGKALSSRDVVMAAADHYIETHQPFLQIFFGAAGHKYGPVAGPGAAMMFEILHMASQENEAARLEFENEMRRLTPEPDCMIYASWLVSDPEGCLARADQAINRNIPGYGGILRALADWWGVELVAGMRAAFWLFTDDKDQSRPFWSGPTTGRRVFA